MAVLALVELALDSPPERGIGQVAQDVERFAEPSQLGKGFGSAVCRRASGKALHWAARANEAPAVALLLDCGANPKLRDEGGKLPVEHAAEEEKLKDTAVYWRLHDAQF